MKIVDPTRAFLYLLLAVAVVIVVGFWIAPQLEWYPPTVKIKLDSNYIGTKPFEVETRDQGKGIRRVSVALVRGAQEFPLVDREYDTPVMEESLLIKLYPEKLGLTEGPAVLRAKAVDRSFWGFFQGNETLVEMKVQIDFTPPRIDLVSRDRYVNLGGSGLVVYRTSSDTTRSGVRIGKYFFPAYQDRLEPHMYVALFTHPHDLAQEKRGVIVAEDRAGNSGQVRLGYTLTKKRYRKSTVLVTESYIQSKIRPFLDSNAAKPTNSTEIFIKVNRERRQRDGAKIREVCGQSTDQILWSESFHQLSNSQVEAKFADHRTYVYNNQPIDEAYHLGYDLAVTRRYPIEAANDGIVVFAGDLGIYGGTVIIDHGLGLFTQYSHMSSIRAKNGEKVKRKQVIGKTGETGLATGDHLHYATLLHGVPVLPLEWWDKKWVQDNILGKVQNFILADTKRPGSPP